MAKQVFNKFLTVRCTEELMEEFRRKSEEFGGPSVVLRDLVEAFVEDRAIISPPVNRHTIYTKE